MMFFGVGSVLAGYLIFSTSPVGLVVALLVAVIMFVVGFLKPDDIDKWLDKTIAFGRGGQEPFDSIETQIKAMNAIGNENEAKAG